MGKMLDLTGSVFGKLTVIGFSHFNAKHKAYWNCKCSCDSGTECIVFGDYLRRGNTQSCGCMRRNDLTGMVFGRLTVLGFSHRAGTEAKLHWRCRCNCESKTELSVMGCHLVSGHTTSCGCIQDEMAGTYNLVHGHSRHGKRTRIFSIFHCMIDRCTNTNNLDFAHYGGRGITICSRWRKSFANFTADMGECPAGMTIDRIDNDGNYSCGHCEECLANGWTANCRWATRKEQSRNTRRNHFLTLDGVTKCISEWAEYIGTKPQHIHRRLGRGWSVRDTLTKPFIHPLHHLPLPASISTDG